MDLALALGRPVSAMPERELVRWRAYARRKLLPSHRVEFYLAQIAMLIAQTMGGAENVTISDYLLEPQRDAEGRLIDPKPAEVDVAHMVQEMTRG